MNNFHVKEYQEVEYIESTGTQYIDTGFISNQDTKVETEYQTANNFNTFQFLYGVRDFTSLGNKSGYSFLNTYQNQVRFDFHDDNYCVPTTVSDIHISYRDGQYYYLDGIRIGSFKNPQAFTAPGSLVIFAVKNVAQTITSNYLPAYARIYYFKIWDNDILVREFVPCYRKSNGVIGMYDAVNNVFYTNQGTGTFLKGEDTGDVTSNSIVTNPTDHTLYAIWEPNS